MTCLERLAFGCVREDNEGKKFSENTLRAAEGKKVWSVMVAIVPGNEAVSMRVLMGNFGWHNKCQKYEYLFKYEKLFDDESVKLEAMAKIRYDDE